VKGKFWLVAATFQLWNRSLQVSGSQSCGAAQCQNQTKSLDKDPQCVKCGSTMRVSYTEPDKPGFVHHVYECIKCRSTQSFVAPV
jgi:hypothetical protein